MLILYQKNGNLVLSIKNKLNNDNKLERFLRSNHYIFYKVNEYEITHMD